MPFYDPAITVWRIKERCILIIKRIINKQSNGPRLWGGEAALQRRLDAPKPTP